MNISKSPLVNKIPPDNLEYSIVIVILATLFIAHLCLAFYLKKLGIFAQYDVLFDTDPSVYVSSMARGWEFDRDIHPGIGLMFNIPLRMIDLFLSALGAIDKGDFLNASPYFISPIFSCLGGFFWWKASFLLWSQRRVRLVALLLFQAGFSQSVFSVIPESYAISGALLTLTLWFSIKAAGDTQYLFQRQYFICWILLACLMSAVTVTMGFLCFGIWLSLALGEMRFTQLMTPSIKFGFILVLSIVAIIFLDRSVYRLEDPIANQLGDTASITKRFIHPAFFQKLIELPMHFMTALIPSDPELIANRGYLEVPESPFNFSFSLESGGTQQYFWLTSGIFVLVMSANAFSKEYSKLKLPIFAVFIFNGALHLFFGEEMFLYSQHWFVYLILALLLCIEICFRRASLAVMICILFVIIFKDFHVWLEILETSSNFEISA